MALQSLANPKGISSRTVISVPEKWSAEWFRTFVKTQLAPLDVRNANAGIGVSITGTPTTPATIALSTEIQELVAQPFVVAETPVGGPAEFNAWRLLAGQSSVVSISDGGAQQPITVGIAANGIGAAQFRKSGGLSVVGNATALLANVTDITAGANGQVLQSAAGALTFAPLPLTALATQAANTVLANATGGTAIPTAVTISSLTANPSASIGLAAVNGSALTFMRSDAAQALSQAIAPTWTGLHTHSPASGSAIVVNGVAAAKSINASTSSTTLGGPQSCNLASSGSDYPYVGYNLVATAVAASYKYDVSDLVSALQFFNGGFAFKTAPTGVAGNAITLTSRLSISNAGDVVIAAPSSGDALTVSNVAGANALVITGNAAGTPVTRFNTQATTGAATATFTATNKPGSNSAVTTWLPVNIDGNTRYIPCFS